MTTKREIRRRLDDVDATSDKSIAQFLSEIYVPPHKRDNTRGGE